jgi:hypothetical protein
MGKPHRKLLFVRQTCVPKLEGSRKRVPQSFISNSLTASQNAQLITEAGTVPESTVFDPCCDVKKIKC